MTSFQRAFTLSLLITSTGSAMAAQATIRGRVVDRSGEGVAGITVYARNVDVWTKRRGGPVAYADEKGEFSFEARPGNYVVTAWDRRLGYSNPDNLFGFPVFGNYRNEAALARVSVEPGDAKNIEIRLGPRSATVTFQVVDDTTDQFVPGASLQVEAALASQPQASTRPQYNTGIGHVRGEPVERLLPSEVDLRLVVMGNGYEDQVLQHRGLSTVRFREGEKASFFVRLRRSP